MIQILYIEDEQDIGKWVTFVPWEQLLTVVGGSFVLFYLSGYIFFHRKAV